MGTIRAASVLALLTAATPGTLLAAQGETTPLFTVNLGTTVWTTLVFFTLLGILWKFAWGPILAAVDAREKAIQGALDQAASRNEEASRLLGEQRQQLAEARRHAGDLLAEGKTAGERLRKEIEEKARTEALAILERARQDIGRERDAALDMLRKESVDLALAAASRLIVDRMDQAKDRRFIERFLDEVSGSGGAQA
ncbi:MAG: F0F1 ATP synthase subunit B [Longimicrobiales bacterium]|nr:F0F1 ATP synthase subunit B [Longimicrobiales bacterium]